MEADQTGERFGFREARNWWRGGNVCGQVIDTFGNHKCDYMGTIKLYVFCNRTNYRA